MTSGPTVSTWPRAARSSRSHRLPLPFIESFPSQSRAGRGAIAARPAGVRRPASRRRPRRPCTRRREALSRRSTSPAAGEGVSSTLPTGLQRKGAPLCKIERGMAARVPERTILTRSTRSASGPSTGPSLGTAPSGRSLVVGRPRVRKESYAGDTKLPYTRSSLRSQPPRARAPVNCVSRAESEMCWTTQAGRNCIHMNET